MMKASYIEQIQKQYQWPVLSVPVDITITLYFPNKLRRDWDNRHKITMDALEWLVLIDDTQIRKATVVRSYDPQRPRVELKINA